MPGVHDHHEYDRDANEQCPSKVITTMSNGNGNRAWEMWLKVVSVMILPWMAFVTIMLFSIDKRVAVIESNRFTTKDGMEMQRSLGNKVDKLDHPPAWLLSRLDHLEAEIDGLKPMGHP